MKRRHRPDSRLRGSRVQRAKARRMRRGEACVGVPGKADNMPACQPATQEGVQGWLRIGSMTITLLGGELLATQTIPLARLDTVRHTPVLKAPDPTGLRGSVAPGNRVSWGE